MVPARQKKLPRVAGRASEFSLAFLRVPSELRQMSIRLSSLFVASGWRFRSDHDMHMPRMVRNMNFALKRRCLTG